MKITIDNQYGPEYKLVTTVEGYAEDINEIIELVVSSLQAQTFHKETILDGMEAYLEIHRPEEEE